MAAARSCRPAQGEASVLRDGGARYSSCDRHPSVVWGYGHAVSTHNTKEFQGIGSGCRQVPGIGGGGSPYRRAGHAGRARRVAGGEGPTRARTPRAWTRGGERKRQAGPRGNGTRRHLLVCRRHGAPTCGATNTSAIHGIRRGGPKDAPTRGFTKRQLMCEGTTATRERRAGFQLRQRSKASPAQRVGRVAGVPDPRRIAPQPVQIPHRGRCKIPDATGLTGPGDSRTCS